jgi:HAD superfamily hydrolase (TIGR01509 family)
MTSGGEEKTLGLRLQQARQAAGLTQQELCHDAGLSYSTLAKIERGAIKSPSIFTIQRIAEVLQTSLDTLIGSGTTATAAPAKKRSKSGIRFVYFDINGCLVRFFHRAFTRIAQDTGVQADLVETAFWHFNDLANRGEMTLAEFNEAFARQIGISQIDWQEYYMKAIEPIEEMHELVGWAAEQYEIGLLSNTMPGFINIMRDEGLLPAVDYKAIIDSSEVHSIKPEPKVYEVAAAKAGVEAHEILLIDDSRANLMAAERLGWHVLWFNDYDPAESAARVREALEPAA